MMTRHPLRVTGRFLWFVGVVLVAAFDFLFRCAFCPDNSKPAARALWLQRHTRRVLKIFKLEYFQHAARMTLQPQRAGDGR